MRYRTAVSFLVLLLAAAPPARADGGTDDLLRQAAFLDAMHKLLEKARALPLGPRATVGAFLDADPGLGPFVFGLVRDRVAREERLFHDGSREADLTLALSDLAVILESCLGKERFHHLGASWSAEVFRRLPAAAGSADLRATGAAHNEVNARSIVRPAPPAPIWKDRIKGQGRHIALRAAEQNAIENLYRTAADLPVGRLDAGDVQRLRDYLDPAGRARRELRAFLARRARVVHGSVRFLEDATCEVDVEIPTAELLAKLEGLVRSRIDPRLAVFADSGYPLDKLVHARGRKILRATGLGFPPEIYLQTHSAAGRRPAWARETLDARGLGVPPDEVESLTEARSVGFLLARRQAVDHILDRVRGLSLLSGGTVGDLLTPAREAELRKLLGEGSLRDGGLQPDGYHVELEVNLWKVWNLVWKWK